MPGVASVPAPISCCTPSTASAPARGRAQTVRSWRTTFARQRGATLPHGTSMTLSFSLRQQRQAGEEAHMLLPPARRETQGQQQVLQSRWAVMSACRNQRSSFSSLRSAVSSAWRGALRQLSRPPLTPDIWLEVGAVPARWYPHVPGGARMLFAPSPSNYHAFGQPVSDPTRLTSLYNHRRKAYSWPTHFPRAPAARDASLKACAAAISQSQLCTVFACGSAASSWCGGLHPQLQPTNLGVGL